MQTFFVMVDGSIIREHIEEIRSATRRMNLGFQLTQVRSKSFKFSYSCANGLGAKVFKLSK
jgi:hypothetical protein